MKIELQTGHGPTAPAHRLHGDLVQINWGAAREHGEDAHLRSR